MNIRPPNALTVPPGPHPSRGGTPYSREVRDLVIWRYLNNLPLNSPEIDAMRAEKKFPCLSTCNNWIQQYLIHGNIHPKRHTGNGTAQREILGRPLERLALFWVAYPKATYAECRAYLHNTDPNVDVYSDSQIFRAKTLLNITRKRASTTAVKAYSLRNLTLRHMYWNEQFPRGMVGVGINDIIDVDETGFKLESSNRGYGYAIRELRCTDAGVYGAGQKVNCLLAIGSDANVGRRWHECWQGGGTTIDRFSDFIEMILDDLDQNCPERQFVFTMDNLNAHKNPRIQTMILAHGHGIIYRAPYWPVDGAIEYVFNTIHSCLLEYYNRIQDLEELKNRLVLIIGQMQNFHRYFIHVGFKV